MRKVVPLVVISGVAFAIASCSLFVDLDGLDDGGVVDAGDEFCVCVDAGNGDAKVDDAGADTSTTIDAGINACLDGGGSAGPRMIQADGYCIDSTEVTVGQYSDFLNDGGAGVTQPGVCAWNNSFLPTTNGTNDPRCTTANVDPGTRAQYPISCIDWCDAWSYCEWAGKRLCGAITGGSVPPASVATNSQWVLACATTAADQYPNDSADGGRCRVGQSDTVPVDSLGCNGGYPGLSDMVGNVEEWVDSCDNHGETDGGGGTAYDLCHDEGDEFDQNFQGFGCNDHDYDNRSETWAGIGFRCCSK